VYAHNKPWGKFIFSKIKKTLPFDWLFVTNSSELNEVLHQQPSKIYFVHWSDKIPQVILNKFECICFHMTDLPYGRGGSPLQNLILNGHKYTQLSALRMTHELDAGPIYGKWQLSLEGRAQEIYERASLSANEAIQELEIKPRRAIDQQGDITYFKRRRPEESEIPDHLSGEALYDFIRMLDAEGYPHAFYKSAHHKIELTHAKIVGGEVRAKARLIEYE
jgi:methionyl-tRNA formyltransferase